jgi:UPF0755 protein
MKLLKTLFFLAVLVVVGYGGLRLYRHFNRPVSTVKSAQTKWREVEGWTNEEISADLDKKQIVVQSDFNNQLTRSALTFDYFGEKPKTKNLEGYLFPDTYFFASTATPEQIINKILANTKQKIFPAIVSEIHSQKRTVYDVVTLASIVEREVGRNTSTVTSADLTALQNERETVAGIFMNRIKAGIPLQSDATIGYITKSKDPSASSSDLQIDSPYNTYKYTGLPPGPIGNPSLSSILAVVNYRKTDYLYFLSKPDGTAVFAKTLDEHNANKAKYLR